LTGAVLTAPIGTDGPDGRLLLTACGKARGYWLGEVASDFPGRAFRLTRFGHREGDRTGDYFVLVGPTPAESSCDCPDAAFRDRPGGCKHLAAVAALVASGEV
jgi:hypothetical protein